MRGVYSGVAVLLAWAVSLGALGAAPTRVPDEIIVKYKSDNRFADHGEVVRRHGRHIEVLREGGGGTFQSGDLDRWEHLRGRIAAIRRDANVLYAEPNYYGHFEETVPPPPDDPSYASQWWLPAVGDRALWALGKGKGVVVAVIDTGVDLTHPDLTANLLATGYNFGDGNATPQDVLGHGTKVAGIIAAAQNNRVGVSGLAPEAKILPIKINPGGQGTFTSDKLASAIDYAVNHGAKVINLSLTVDQQTQTVQDSIQNALDKGVAMVAASGNEGGAVAFPASMAGVIGVAATNRTFSSIKVDFGGSGYVVGDTITLDGGVATIRAVVTVGAVDVVSGAVSAVTITTSGSYSVESSAFKQYSTTSKNGSGATFRDGIFANAVASFSNTGPEITVAAPGVNIYSTVLGASYGGGSGTSFAAPIVSATVADLLSINANLLPESFALSLRSTAAALSGYSYGSLNSGAAGNTLVPHLQIGKPQFSGGDSVSVNYTLPPTGGAVDVYVGVQTPFGDFSLRGDGTWVAVAQGNYLPIALGYQGGTAVSGTLFGSAGIFPAIPLAAFPAGTYTWSAALAGSTTRKMVGDAMVTVMQLN
ncbi:MAG: S8 family serine peptidase [Sulfuricella sp.]|nr:S8 family serine peptidase [Sulfuricella sp.]